LKRKKKRGGGGIEYSSTPTRKKERERSSLQSLPTTEMEKMGEEKGERPYPSWGRDGTERRRGKWLQKEKNQGPKRGRWIYPLKKRGKRSTSEEMGIAPKEEKL